MTLIDDIGGTPRETAKLPSSIKIHKNLYSTEQGSFGKRSRSFIGLIMSRTAGWCRLTLITALHMEIDYSTTTFKLHNLCFYSAAKMYRAGEGQVEL